MIRVTPSDPNQRACQLLLRFSCLIEDVHTNKESSSVTCETISLPVFNLCFVVEYKLKENLFSLVVMH